MKKLITLISACVSLLVMQGCNNEYFDKEKVEEILELSFHNDTIDANHTWRLMTEHSIQVTTSIADVERIEILSADPHESEKCELLTKENASAGETVSLSYSVHLAQQQLYAAAVTTSGAYHIKAFNKGDMQVNVPTDPKASQRTYKPQPQEVYYCFCNGYPQPSRTWDFNDLVLRISRSVVDENTLRLNVTLVAVGTTLQEAAALRLVGVNYDEVASISRIDDKSFGTNEAYGRMLIRETDDLLKSRLGEAVINLFDDAHIAMNVKGFDQTGQVYRFYYNVSNSLDPEYEIRNEVTVSYLITFKNAGRVKNITFDKLDPFLVYSYNGATWEIHKFIYKLDEVLFEYYGGNPFNYNTHYTWALEVPYSWFRYPIEGTAMGTFREGIRTGAYHKYEHSFGEWAADRNKATDWYLYPEKSMVY